MSDTERTRRGPILWLAGKSRRFWIGSVSSHGWIRRALLVCSAVLIAIVITAAVPPIADELKDRRLDWDDIISDNIIEPVLSLGFGALVLLSTVRIFNRRASLGRRGRVAVAAAAAMLIYALSFGPACRLCEDGHLDGRATWILYRPMTWLTIRGPDPIGRAIFRWVDLFRRDPRDSPSYPIGHEYEVQYPDVKWL